jgi:dynein heavy chain
LCHFQVEAYMGGIVDKMRSELRAVMAASVADYPAKPRERWMFDWPSQVALVSWRLGFLT